MRKEKGITKHQKIKEERGQKQKQKLITIITHLNYALGNKKDFVML